MAWTDIFKRKNPASAARTLSTVFHQDGLRINFANGLQASTVEALFEAAHDAPPQDAFLATYAAQLAQEGLCQINSDGILLPWGQVFALRKHSEHAGAVAALDLPPEADVRPILDCQASLIDANFEIRVVGWIKDQQQIGLGQIVGATATLNDTVILLPEAAWAMLAAIESFNAQPASQKTQHSNELAWGEIRQLATRAGALYRSAYLKGTVVLTPQTLRLPMSKTDVLGTRVLTVEPTFDGAPKEWIESFDGYHEVQDHYDMVADGGRVRVVLSEPVKRVLRVIKREMPRRRVAGARAERFVHNPWSYLGDSAQEVISEKEFLEDRAAAGPLHAIFSIASHAEGGRIEYVELVITEHFIDGTASTDTRRFAEPAEFGDFIAELDNALREEREVLPWDEYDLTLDGEASRQLEEARQLHFLWKNQPAARISFDDIYALEGYSERIEGIGIAKPIYVPVFQKPSNEEEGKKGWLPEDLMPMVAVTLAGHNERVLIPLTREWVDEFESQVAAAQRDGAPTVTNTALPTPVDTGEARALVDAFQSMLKAQDEVKTSQGGREKGETRKRETLLVKTNFHGIDYLEARIASLSLPADKAPVLPSCLRPELQLKAHQHYGVAWFQHLLAHAPRQCRGALLADDMGLGKTLQLLCVLGAYYESHEDASPSLILAPKSLLENWKKEAARFFTPSYPEVLVLYGEELNKRKQPLSLIDEQLHSRGVTDLLCPGWLGSAKILVTTYEVLTGYEFSLAKQPFAFIICDEAQRIKNPGTQVTLAAKKLRADFRIACTGTPVENSLADLWCLFDFVQPGFLGGLEEFGKTYRRPIECNTPELQKALENLQKAIAPQTLRRTKKDIAADLPQKFYVHNAASAGQLQFSPTLAEGMRLEIGMSPHQVTLYKGGLKRLQDATAENDGRKRAQLSFAALHLMKAVCAEPYCIPGRKFLVDERGVDAHLSNSQKMSWLLKQLEDVRDKGDKAIVFTELREVQNALSYFLRQTFGLRPFIINGDSQNRQDYIDRFTAKEGFDVIILSTLAAGAGLNVTAANHVFHFTRAWNPSKENQATDRAYRIGQDKDVFVYCPVMVTDEFPTFEVRLDEMMTRKAQLADSTLDGSTMLSMLNGVSGDIGMRDLMGDGKHGEALKEQVLTIRDIDALDGISFEYFCQLLWQKQGYLSLVTEKHGGDGGIDVVALKGTVGELLQCKTSKNPEIGWDAVKEVFAGATKYQTRYKNTRFSRIAITNQRFTTGAREQATLNRVRLIEREELTGLMKKYPVTNYDLDEVLQEVFVAANVGQAFA